MTIQLTKSETNTSIYVNFDNVKFYEPSVVEGSDQTIITFIDGSTLLVSELATDISGQELAFASLRAGGTSPSASRIASQLAATRPINRGRP